MIQGAIFDFDGTLFDSMFIWNSIGEDYLRSIGFTPRENLAQVFKSMSLYQAACYYKNEYGVTLSVEEIINGVNCMIDHYYSNIVLPKDGVIDFLKKLQNHNVKMCIATATDKFMVKACLKRCHMLDFFSDIFTCSSVGHGKDEPYIFRNAMLHLDTPKPYTAVFEDALYAAKTAKKDAFPVIGIYDKYEENTVQLKTLADIYLDNYLNFNEFWKESINLNL